MKCNTINQHIKLFKKIPCGNFGPSKLFFDKFKTKKTKDITMDDIFLAYYYISTEMMDSVDSNWFIVKKNQPPYNRYDCHDLLTDEHLLIKKFKDAKVYNGVIKNYYNRTPKSKYYGLVAIPKQKDDNLDEIIQDFKIFAANYKTTNFCIDALINERLYRLGDEEIYNLYILLKTLCDKATFQYKQAGSIILAQELANVMANQDIIKNNQHTRRGVEIVRQHKQLMFGELQR